MAWQPWQVKIIDEFRREYAAFWRSMGRKTRKTKTVKRAKKAAGRPKQAVRRAKSKVNAAQYGGTKRRKQLEIAERAKVRDNPRDFGNENGMRRGESQIHDMPIQEQAALVPYTYAAKANNWRWRKHGEWAVEWEGPSGMTKRQWFHTGLEAYDWCHEPGNLPRNIVESERRWDVRVQYRDEDEFICPFSDDAVERIEQKGRDEAELQARDEMYGKQARREVRAGNPEARTGGFRQMYQGLRGLA